MRDNLVQMWDFLTQNGLYPALVSGVVGLGFTYLNRKLFPAHPPGSSGTTGGVGGIARRGVGWVGRSVASFPGSILLITAALLAVYTAAGGWDDPRSEKIGPWTAPNWLADPLKALLAAFNVVLWGRLLGQVIGALVGNDYPLNNKDRMGRIWGVALVIVFALPILYMAWAHGRERLCDGLVGQAKQANKNKEFDRAIALADEAVRMNPGHSGAYFERAWGHGDRGEADAAIADYTRVIEIDPGNSAAFHNRGNQYKAKRDFDRAITDYTRSLELDDKYAPGFYLRGRCRLEKKDWATAVADFTRAIELDRGYADAYERRAEAHLGLGDAEKAKADQAEAAKLRAK